MIIDLIGNYRRIVGCQLCRHELFPRVFQHTKKSGSKNRFYKLAQEFCKFILLLKNGFYMGESELMMGLITVKLMAIKYIESNTKVKPREFYIKNPLKSPHVFVPIVY